MGCISSGRNSQNKTIIKPIKTFSLSQVRKKRTINNNPIQKKNYISKISQPKWLHILNYMNYTELKEIGKVNRFFRMNCVKDEVLTKFFKKRINDTSPCLRNKYENSAFSTQNCTCRPSRNYSFDKNKLEYIESFALLRSNGFSYGINDSCTSNHNNNNIHNDNIEQRCIIEEEDVG